MRWLLALMIAVPLFAQPASEETLVPNVILTWNPPTDIYPPYVADPRRSRHIIAIVSALDSELPDSQNLRWGLSIGGTYGVARLGAAGSRKEEIGAGVSWKIDERLRTYADVGYGLNLG